jgi:hypothetical protein
MLKAISIAHVKKFPNWMTAKNFPGYLINEKGDQMRVYIQGFYTEMPP